MISVLSLSSPALTMDVSDFLCHICLGVLIEPVTMPCKHRICQVSEMR